MVVLFWSISGVCEVICALGRAEGLEQRSDPLPGGLYCPLGGFAQQRLELGKDLFDRIEVGAVGWQEEQLSAGSADGVTHGLSLVAAEIIDDDDVAWLEGGYQHYLDIGEEDCAIDRSVDDTGRIDPIGAQRCQECERAPAALRNFGDQPLTSRRPPMGAGHVGLGPGLVDEDQTRRIKSALILLPLRPAPRDVGTILLAGAQAFF